MTHPTIFHRIAWNWRVHGIPRCAGWFPITEESCRAAIWPWQDTAGNGEEPEHARCTARREAQYRGFDFLSPPTT